MIFQTRKKHEKKIFANTLVLERRGWAHSFTLTHRLRMASDGGQSLTLGFM